MICFFLKNLTNCIRNIKNMFCYKTRSFKILKLKLVKIKFATKYKCFLNHKVIIKNKTFETVFAVANLIKKVSYSTCASFISTTAISKHNKEFFLVCSEFRLLQRHKKNLYYFQIILEIVKGIQGSYEALTK